MQNRLIVKLLFLSIGLESASAQCSAFSKRGFRNLKKAKGTKAPKSEKSVNGESLLCGRTEQTLPCGWTNEIANSVASSALRPVLDIVIPAGFETPDLSCCGRFAECFAECEAYVLLFPPESDYTCEDQCCFCASEFSKFTTSCPVNLPGD